MEPHGTHAPGIPEMPSFGPLQGMHLAVAKLLGISFYVCRMEEPGNPGSIVFEDAETVDEHELGDGSLLGRRIAEVLSPDLARRVVGMLADSMADGLPRAVGPVPTGDGRYRTFRILPFPDGIRACVFLQDSTTEHRTALAMQASEEKFAAAFHMSPDAIAINRLSDGLYIDLNEGFTDALGWTARDLVGRTSIDAGIWVSPAERQELLDALHSSPTGQASGLLFTFRHKTGRELKGLMSAALMEVEGTPCILSITRDLTERLRADEALRASGEKFTAAFRTSPDAMSITRMDNGTFLEVNESYTDIFGWTPAELTGRTATGMGLWADPEDRARLVRAVEESPEGQASNLEFSFCHKDGRSLIGLVSAARMEVDGVPCLFATTRDMTERLATEAAVRAEAAKFALAFQSSPDAMVLNRFSDGQFIELNLGFTEMTGWQESDVLGRSRDELHIWESRADLDDYLRRMERDGSVRDLEVRWRHKDGHLIIGSLSASMLEVEGERLVLAVTRDVTERRQAAMELRRSKERTERTAREAFELVGRLTEVRDPYTRGHQDRVARISVAIGHELALGGAEIELLRTAAQVHDIGKLNVPSEILTKPGKLSPMEWQLVQGHAEYGYQLLRDMEFVHPMEDIIRAHHERMDGSGYPRGLRGEEIPFLARVIAVADVLEAMSAHRPYRPALGAEAALEEIRRNPGLFDAAVVKACLSLAARGELPL